MLIHHLLENAADRYPDKPAVWHKDSWSTYAELETAANRIARRLREGGVRRGDRVALLMENSPDYIVCHMGALKAGAVNVSLNTETTAASLAYLLADCGAAAILIGRKFAKHLADIPPASLPSLRLVAAEDAAAAEILAAWRPALLPEMRAEGPDGRVAAGAVDIDLASIVYTSGSTGKPKGVMLSHLNLMSNNRSIVSYLGLTPADRMMAVLPFYYIYGTSLMYTHFAAGGSLVIENRFAFPNVVLDGMQKLEATGFAGVPSTFMILLNKSTLKAKTFPALRYVTQAGGAMAPHIQKQVVEAFHPARLFVMYGSTEASPRLTYLPPDDLPRKWGSIGKAIPNVEVFPADAEGRPVAKGAVGELAARGSNIMMGYWKDPEGTAEVVRNGAYLTGDLGREDEEGFLFVEGRVKDIIKAGGNRVGAREIEEKILEMEGVAEAAVIGVEDPILGEAIKAFVVPKAEGTLTEASVKSHLQERLPPFKMPKWIEFRGDLPKNESGKILKARLKDAQST